jgi:hypothetical protein
MRWAIRATGLLAVVAALVVGWFTYQGISASIHAEHVLQAAQLTIQLLRDYVVRHDGEWPRSWSDLEGLPSRSWGMFEWPKDSQNVQRYVTVDFNADTRRLARQGVNGFDAVRPIGPYYPFKDEGSVAALLKAIRERARVGQ